MVCFGACPNFEYFVLLRFAWCDLYCKLHSCHMKFW